MGIIGASCEYALNLWVLEVIMLVMVSLEVLFEVMVDVVPW